MDRYSQFHVDGPCYVLFSGELQQPGLGRYLRGLCGVRGFCPWHYAPPHICSHLLWTLSVAHSWSFVHRPIY